MSCIDWNTLDELGALTPGAPRIALRVVATFLEHTPPVVETLAAAAHDGDLPSVQETAHKLKSSFANVGALGASELARSVDQQAREGRIDEKAAAQLSAGFDDVCRELRAWLERNLPR